MVEGIGNFSFSGWQRLRAGLITITPSRLSTQNPEKFIALAPANLSETRLRGASSKTVGGEA